MVPRSNPRQVSSRPGVFCRGREPEGSCGCADLPRDRRPLSRNFRFRLYVSSESYACCRIDSKPNHHGLFWVASRLALAAPLIRLLCFVPPPRFSANTCAHWMTSEPIDFRFCSATRPAAAVPQSFSACCRTASDSGALRPAKANNTEHASPVVRPSSPTAAANSSATSCRSGWATPVAIFNHEKWVYRTLTSLARVQG